MLCVCIGSTVYTVHAGIDEWYTIEMMRFSHRTTWPAAALGCFLALFVSGCGTIEKPYQPQRVGRIDSERPTGPIEVQILCAQETVVIGEPLYFTVIIRNVGDRPLWLPRNPDLLMTWIYPNGRRDNFIREQPPPQFFSAYNAVLLQPGQQMTRTIAVKTYYFPLPGITEFRAILRGTENTNPELHPFWSGRAESNGYGIRVLKKPRGTQEAFRDQSRVDHGLGLILPTAQASPADQWARFRL